MNQKQEIAHEPSEELRKGAPEHRGYGTVFSDGTEKRPHKVSGWREQKRHASGIAKYVEALSFSVWLRRGVMAVSALENAEAPDGTKEVIPQWHISFSKFNARCPDDEVRQALACFGLAGAEEDNHHPGGLARHFWMPLDPARRVDCECSVTETTVVEPDGYTSTTPKAGPCSGCELVAIKIAEFGEAPPCPLHPSGPG